MYDLLVIGSGPGGYTCAIRAAQLGAKVALIEKDQIGGTCLNRGCIPTKSLIECVEKYTTAKQADYFGILVSDLSFDFKKMQLRKDQNVSQLRKGTLSLIKSNQIDFISGTGKLIAPGKVEVSSPDGAKYQLECKNIVLALGSVPSRIPIEGIDLPGVITSDEALNLNTVPESLTIIGGGVVGVEMATIFSGLGARVSILEMMDGILPMIDHEIVEVLKESFSKKNIEVITLAEITKISREEGRLVVFFQKNGETHKLKSDMVLISVGRRPNTTGGWLEKAGIAMKRGKIIVGSDMRTNLPGVFAIGDVSSKIQLAHVAMAEGVIAAENALGGERVMDYASVPSCIFCDPEIVGIGLTEQDARNAGHDVIIGKFPVIRNGRAMTMGVTEGMAKIISDCRFGAILGMHMIGPRVTEMSGELSLALSMETTLDELRAAIHAHPTVAECIFEAANASFGECIHLPPDKLI